MFTDTFAMLHRCSFWRCSTSARSHSDLFRDRNRSSCEFINVIARRIGGRCCFSYRIMQITDIWWLCNLKLQLFGSIVARRFSSIYIHESSSNFSSAWITLGTFRSISNSFFSVQFVCCVFGGWIENVYQFSSLRWCCSPSSRRTMTSKSE